MSKDLVAASATPLVLAILAEGDSYGYAIIKRVAELSGGHLQWTDGMLYPVLHRLERQGLVAAKWSASETGRAVARVRARALRTLMEAAGHRVRRRCVHDHVVLRDVCRSGAGRRSGVGRQAAGAVRSSAQPE